MKWGINMQLNVLEYLENSVKKYPNKVGFTDPNNSYTFKQFDLLAKSIASGICRNFSLKNEPIVVLVDRNVDSLICFMAILYSGNFYVPIDNKMPKQRLKSILDKVNPKLVICSKNDENALSDFDVDTVSFEEYKTFDIDEVLIKERRERILDIDPAYVIFTSGSTGQPKGIVISHRSIIDFVDWMEKACDISNKCVFANQAPFYFDLSVKDIYLTLKCGASMNILSKKELMFPMLLVDFLNSKKVNTLIWATSAFNLVANSGVLVKKKPKYLKKVILGGEALLAKNLNIWRASLPKVKYINLYGPTEVTVDCTYYPVDNSVNDNEEIPIGKACENKEVILLNEELKEVALGEVGEICVRGTGLAKGYYNDPEKTKEAFIQNPLNPYYTDIIYRTGDVGVIKEDGYIYFKARKDSQIKHMGYRIELGEIETAINSCDAIKEAICFYDDVANKIVCVYEGDLTDSDLIKHIESILPKYMYPNVFKNIEKMPHNANGKIDRVKLKEIYFDEKNK